MSNPPSMGKGRPVTVDSHDLIDAMGSLELRIDDLEQWAEVWEKEDEPEMARERRENAAQLKGVLERFREAMKR